MQIMYLTPVSISNLTQFILAFVIAVYFLYLTRRTWRPEQPPLATLFLAGAFSSIAIYTMLVFLNASLRPDLRFYVMSLEGVALALSLLFALQFAYHFPVPLPGKAWEAKLVLGLDLIYLLWEIQLMVSRFMMIQQGYVEYRPAIADYPLLAGFLWFLIILFRQTIHASVDHHNTGGLRNLWQPRGRLARAARAFFLFSALPLLLTAVTLLRDYFIISGGMTEAILSLGILFMFAVFALLYLNYLPETTSFMVKLVGVVLAASLAALGSVGWIITPAYTAAYRNDNFMASKHSLRFTPNPQGGYAVTTIPFRFDRDFGDKLGLVDKWVDLGFDFPFYGQVWDKAYLMSDGAVSFGEALDWQDTKYRYGPLPVIFPLIVDFVSSDTFLEGASAGFFAKSATDKLTVTWSRLPEYYAHNTRYTFQLTLYPSGIFEIAYDDLPATQNYDIFEAWNTAWLIGITPGSQKSDARHIRFTADLPFAGDDRGGIVEDYYLDFRRYLHRIFAPLAYFTLGSSLFILIGFPLFFRVNLVEPLNTLLKSVRQINAGNLETEVTVMYRDEIGFLAESFNAATAKQRTLVSDLEARVAERTVDLEAYAAQNMRLLKEEYHQREVVESLRQAMLTTSRSMDHNVVLPAILAQLREIIHFDGAGIFLLDDDCLTLVHGVGLKPTTDYLRLPVADSHYITHAFNRQETEIISGTERDPHQQLFFQDELLGCLMVTPLLFGQQSLGVLALHRVDDILFVAEDAALLETFATQSAIAVKNAELYQQAKNAASLEERTRLAQDLHDAVNQTLFTAGIMAEAVPKVWEKDPERGRQGLEEVRRLTKGALAEMRTLLMELRPHTLIERPLGLLLRHVTDAVSSRMRIPIGITVENDTLLPPDVQIALYRIAQESFNNIVKYAEATEVSVYLSNHPYQVILSIQDNGAGFTPAEVPPGHMGLKIMRERAESIGALLTVTSRPGDGTRVEVVWNRKG